MGDVLAQEAEVQWGVPPGMVVEHPGMGFSRLEEIVKNPFGEIYSYDVETSNGERDDRLMITEDIEMFEHVVSLNGECTGSIVTFDGYEALDGGTIVATAAHCVEGYTNDELTIYGSYAGEDGGLERFQMQADQVWVHPFHGDFNRNADPDTVDSRADIAFLYFDEETPPLVTAAEFSPIDLDGALLEMADEIDRSNLPIEEAIKKYEQQYLEDYENLVIPSVGFSSDLVGLAADPRSTLTSIGGSQIILTDADGAPGSSGGGNYVGELGDDGVVTLERNDEGQPIIIAVNSAQEMVTDETPIPDTSYGTALKPEFLETVPFLEPTEEVCEATSGVINNPHGANIRYGDGEVFETLARDINGPSALPWGSQIDIHTTVENHLGEEWALVAGPNGRTGYVHADLIDFDTPDCETPAASAPVVAMPTP